MKKVILAVTGASGAIYARQTMKALLRSAEVAEVAVIVSANGGAVMEYEKESLSLADSRVKVYNNGDMFSPPASGSAGYDAMVVVPCSVGSAGRIAAGVSADLIGRAADVMLKERRTLILAVRETPLSSIHLRNLATLSEAGAVILPAAPSFYSHPTDIESLCATVTERVMKMLGLDTDAFRWNGREG